MKLQTMPDIFDNKPSEVYLNLFDMIYTSDMPTTPYSRTDTFADDTAILASSEVSVEKNTLKIEN